MPPLLPPPVTQQQRPTLLQLFLGCFAAFLIASLFFFVVFSTFGTFWQVRSFTFTLVLAYAVVLGLPVFVILWWRRWVNLGTCAGAGAVVVTVSAIHLGLLAWMGPIPLAFAAFFGALAGLAFWGILLAAGVLPQAHDGQARRGAAGVGRATAVAAVPILFIGAFYLFGDAIGRQIQPIFRMMRGGTCHNIVHGWDTTDKLSSRAYMLLELASEEAPKLTKALEEFAAAHKLQFRHDLGSEPVRPFISVCNGGLTIKASLYEINVLERQLGSGWQQITKALIERIEALWPGRLRFRAPDGSYMPRPKELQ